MMPLPRFYPILDVDTLVRNGRTATEAADALLEAGARILQFRYKAHYSREVFEEAERVSAECRSAGALFVINDHADIATLLEAALHLGQEDLTASDARRVTGAECVIGLSTHNEAQLRAAAGEPVDYLALGPIFNTGSKRNPDPVVGLEELKRLRPLADKPLVAIGGISLQNAGSVYAAGANSIAVIGALYCAPCTRSSIRARAEEWLRLTS
jgi:thiamine-phosphate pyrophosphorylase